MKVIYYFTVDFVIIADRIKENGQGNIQQPVNYIFTVAPQKREGTAIYTKSKRLVLQITFNN